MNLNLIIQTLKSGNILAHPADTCFGFAADLLNSPKGQAGKNVIQKIQLIKGRQKLKPMSIMFPISQMDQLKNWVVLNEFSKSLTTKLFPGPVTLILPKGPQVPEWYFPETDKIGIRFPDHTPTQEILEAFGSPLITTSANVSGQPSCFDSECVKKQFEGQEYKPDFILEGKCEAHTTASTVLMVHEDSVEVLREGPVSKDNLEDLNVRVVR